MSDKKKRILIFDDDKTHAKHLIQLLPASEWELVFEGELYQATQKFKNRPFDVVVVSLDMPDEEGEELAFWVCENYPKRKVVLIGSPDQDFSEQMDKLRQHKSVLGFLPKPVPKGRLLAFLEQLESGLVGQVQRMNVIDLLQILRINKPQCVISFNEQCSRTEGILWLRGGEVIHAELWITDPQTLEKALKAQGVVAFNQIVQFKNGEFQEQHWREPSQVSIQLPFDSLSMNAAQLLDETVNPFDPFAAAQENKSIRHVLLVDTDPLSRMIIQKTLI